MAVTATRKVKKNIHIYHYHISISFLFTVGRENEDWANICVPSCQGLFLDYLNFFIRGTHYDEFSKQVMNVLNQWETDLQKTREAEEKLEVLNN